MKKIFIIGGMGAGKSTARRALENQGLSCIDLDKIGHEIHSLPAVKNDLVAVFGESILDAQGKVNRHRLAAKAFKTPASTRELNHIALPRIEEVLRARLEELKAANCDAVVVEYSAFRKRTMPIANLADCIVAILAPLEMRVKRLVASGFSEEDARNRIARQVSDAERIKCADIVFNNVGTEEDLCNQIVSWWHSYKDASS